MRDLTSFINQYHTAIISADQNSAVSQDDESTVYEEMVWTEALLLEYAKRFFD